MIKREVTIGDCRLLLGDCLEILPLLGKVDAVVTDPPFSSGGFQEAGKSSGSIGTRSKEVIEGDTLSTRGYLRLIARVCRATAADEFAVFTDWRMWINTFDALEEGGVRVRNMLVWDKTYGGMGLPWRGQHELIAYGKRRPASGRTSKETNVIACPRSGNEFHPTEKPVALMERIIKNLGGMVVVDPFMGSGTTGLGCLKAGRHFIGIEISEHYFDIACARIRKAYAQPDFFVERAPEPKQEALLFQAPAEGRAA